MSKIFKLQIKLFNFYFILWYHKKKIYNPLSRNRSSKVINVIKLNQTLQNVPYCHVIIVINYNTNNIHISYQSANYRLQDKLFFSYVRFVKRTQKNFERGTQPPYPTPSCVTACTYVNKNCNTRVPIIIIIKYEVLKNSQ
jgi:hypothetical protein